MIFLGVIYYLEEKRSYMSEFTRVTCLPTCIIIQEVQGIKGVQGLGDWADSCHSPLFQHKPYLSLQMQLNFSTF